MSHISVDLKELHKTYFGQKFHIDEKDSRKFFDETKTTSFGVSYTKLLAGGGEHEYLNRYIFLPITIKESDDLFIEFKCATMRVTNKKTIIKTPVARRFGTVKEQYSTGDYIFTINGVLIGENRKFPDDQIYKLKKIYESHSKIELECALSDLFVANILELDKVDERCPVVIESLDFPEIKGQSTWHVPFSMVCETDFAETLIYSKENLNNDRYYIPTQRNDNTETNQNDNRRY